MNTNNTQTVVAKAPEMKTTPSKTWAVILAENLTPQEIKKYKAEIKREYEEIYQYYSADGEIISLLTLDKKYNEEFDELRNQKRNHDSNKDLIKSVVKLYPQISSECPDIETDLKLKYIGVIKRHHEFNGRYIFMLRSQQRLLEGLLEDNMSIVKELNKNNKKTKADEAENPNLKEDKKEKKSLLGLINKELRKIIAANKEIIAIFKIKELIESKSTLIFSRNSRWGFSMEFDDDEISVIINDNVSICKNGNGWDNLGPLRHFDIEIFLQKIPKRYSAGILRDQKIDSIFMD